MPRNHTVVGNQELFKRWSEQKNQWEKIFDGSINELKANDLAELIKS